MSGHLEKFQPADLEVLNGTHWLVTVRSKQVTFGDTVVLPKRAIATFSDMTADEAVELVEILGRLEHTATNTLGADRVNAVAAMMKDPFVHFHFFPRYSTPKTVNGQEWTDEDWPRAITFRDVQTPSELLVDIRQLLSASLCG